MRSPQRRAHRRATKWCKETKFFRIRKQQTQYATHSGVRTAQQRKSSAFGCDEGNTQPTGACALQSDDILKPADATNAMRNPQRRTHCGAAKLLDPWLPGDDGTFVVLVILVKYAMQSNDILRIRMRHSNAQPTAARASQSNEMVILPHSDATNAIRNPQRRAHCTATKVFGIRMRRRQHACPQRRARCKGTIF